MSFCEKVSVDQASGSVRTVSQAHHSHSLRVVKVCFSLALKASCLKVFIQVLCLKNILGTQFRARTWTLAQAENYV